MFFLGGLLTIRADSSGSCRINSGHLQNWPPFCFAICLIGPICTFAYSIASGPIAKRRPSSRILLQLLIHTKADCADGWCGWMIRRWIQSAHGCVLRSQLFPSIVAAFPIDLPSTRMPIFQGSCGIPPHCARIPRKRFKAPRTAGIPPNIKDSLDISQGSVKRSW